MNQLRDTRRSASITRWVVLGVLSACSVLGVAAGVDAQKAGPRADGLYDFTAKGHSGTLAVKTVKGGLLIDLNTVSPKGATCSAAGRATGGTILTFRQEDGGFRLTLQRDQITISGLLGRVAEQPFCGLNASLTGVYKRRGALDAAASATLGELEKNFSARR